MNPYIQEIPSQVLFSTMPRLRWQPPPPSVSATARLALLREALHRTPGDITLRLRLGHLLVRLGDLDQARTVEAPLRSHRSARYEELLSHAGLQAVLGDPTAALATLEGAAEEHVLDPSRRRRHVLLEARVQRALTREAEAERSYQSVLAASPDDPEALRGLASLYMEQHRPEAALPVLDRALSCTPDARLLSWKVAVLERMGRAGATQQLLDYDRFLKAKRLWDEPSQAEEINAALQELVTAGLPMRYNDVDPASRHSWRFNGLHRETSPAARTLHARLQQAVQRYAETLPEDDHPFIRGWPERVRLSSWALLCRAEGFEEPHIHSRAWLSGVYYVAVPPSVRAEDEAHAGWLAFGAMPSACNASTKRQPHFLLPQPGLCVLFPSFYYHHTRPTAAASPRICVAFDVEPCDSSGPGS